MAKDSFLARGIPDCFRQDSANQIINYIMEVPIFLAGKRQTPYVPK